MGKAAGEMIASAALLRAWLAVIGGVISFALLIETAGLLPAVVVTVLVASRGSRDMPIRDALVVGAGLALAVTMLFVVLLNQPLAILEMW
jgi:hypothetical protein